MDLHILPKYYNLKEKLLNNPIGEFKTGYDQNLISKQSNTFRY